MQRVAQLGQRAALATLARDPGALAQIRRWPGRSDLSADVRGADDYELLRVVRRDVANRRLLILEMHDAVTTIAVPPPATNRAIVAKPPPGMTLTAAQEADAAVAAMDSMDKVIAALQRSVKYMGPELANAFLQLFTLDNLKVLAAFIIAGAIANTNPVSAVVFDAAMLAMVFYLAGSAGIDALGLLITTTIAVIAAKGEADLDRGGENYAKAFVGLGGAVFMAWLARRIIKQKNTGGGGGGRSGGNAEPPPPRAAEPARPRQTVAESNAAAVEDAVQASRLRAARIAETGEFGTPPGKSCFYSGPGNRELALAEKDLVPIDRTAGGKALEAENLYSKYNPLRNEADSYWSTASQRYAAEAKGEVTAYVKGASPDRVFGSTELPALLKNADVTQINGIPTSVLRQMEGASPGSAFEAVVKASP